MNGGVRVGQGIDVHPLVPGRPLVLGGVTVPFERGLAGHSDADVVAHAVCDALLGAAGLEELGTLFPARDDRWRDASSMLFCAEVSALVAGAGWGIGNVGATVLCDQPRLAPHLPAMVTALAAALSVAPSQVRVTAKSTEGLGLTGRGEGIAAIAVCLLERSPGSAG